jgi:hypothetical protein
MMSVNQIGMGQDMWLVPFDNITKILEVCKLNSKTSRNPGLTILNTDILLHRASLPRISRTDQDLDLALLPPHFPPDRAPESYLGHDRALRSLHHHFCYCDCPSMYTNPVGLGALGWPAPRKMHQPKRRCVVFCRCQHCPRLDRHNTSHEGNQKTRNQSASQSRRHVYVPRWSLVSSLPYLEVLR